MKQIVLLHHPETSGTGFTPAGYSQIQALHGTLNEFMQNRNGILYYSDKITSRASAEYLQRHELTNISEDDFKPAYFLKYDEHNHSRNINDYFSETVKRIAAIPEKYDTAIFMPNSYVINELIKHLNLKVRDENNVIYDFRRDIPNGKGIVFDVGENWADIMHPRPEGRMITEKIKPKTV